jgi:hypothetical protein
LCEGRSYLFAEDFDEEDFFELLFFEEPFFEELDFLLPVLLALFLLPERFFSFGLGGMLAPDLRASLKPMAIACFGFFTFLWLRPDSSS